MKKFIAAFILILSYPALWAGPWINQKNSFYLSVNSVYSSFDEVVFYDDTTKPVPTITFIDTALSLSYIPINDLQLGLSVPFNSSTADDKTSKTNVNALGDGRFRVDYVVLREEEARPVSMSLASEIKVPLSSYPVDRLNAPGDRQVDIDASLSIGRFFAVGSSLLFTDLGGGYRYRFKETPSEIFASYEAGIILFEVFTVRPFIEYVHPFGGIGLGSPEFAKAGGPAVFPQVAEEYLKGGLGLSLILMENLDISIFAGTTLMAKNSSKVSHIGLNIGYLFY